MTKQLSVYDQQRLREYVEHVYDIFQGNGDQDLLTKSKSLDSIAAIAGDKEWMNFVAAAHDENHVQLGKEIVKNPESPHQTLKHMRYHVLNTMFSKYGLLKAISTD